MRTSDAWWNTDSNRHFIIRTVKTKKKSFRLKTKAIKRFKGNIRRASCASNMAQKKYAVEWTKTRTQTAISNVRLAFGTHNNRMLGGIKASRPKLPVWCLGRCLRFARGVGRQSGNFSMLRRCRQYHARQEENKCTPIKTKRTSCALNQSAKSGIISRDSYSLIHPNMINDKRIALKI